MNRSLQRSLDERNRFLVALDDVIRPLEDPEEMVRTAARMLGQHLKVNRCAYADVEPDQDAFNLTGDYDDGVDSMVGRYTFTQFGAECLRSMLAGEAYAVCDSETDPRVEAVREFYRSKRLRAVVWVPLLKSSRLVAAMSVQHAAPRDWRPDEVELLMLVASRCWESIERARIARERENLLQAERRARADAEHANLLKDEFLATLSHELRTPLNAILGWTYILRTKLGEEDPAREGVEVIERNARAQTAFVDELLEMNRIMSGKVRLDVQRVDLDEVVNEAADSLRPTAQAKGLRLETILDAQAGPVYGDPNRLRQVFWNLIANGIKFTPRGGKVEVVLARADSNLEVSVIDTGDGMDADFVPYVFDRFRQADASTARKHGGLGLGLAIARQLTELHGGTIRAASTGKGAGSTFTVSLPLPAIQTTVKGQGEEVGRARSRAVSSTVSSTMALNENISLRGVRVLVVDDELDSRNLERQLLENYGADVITAGSTAEALQEFAETKFDVLVSDIGMPGEDGYALLRQVRGLGSERGGDVPALALTAYARSEDRMRAILAGFQMHVSKPVEAAELIAMVASLAGRTGHA